jgi:hypothetical protein
MQLRPFRLRLGNAVARGRSDRTRRDLGRALKSYSKGTGGGSAAARRLGSAARTGGRVYQLFSNGAAVGPDGRTVTLSTLAGQDVRAVVDTIVDALVDQDGDRDRVSTALQDALAVALAGVDKFDPAAITHGVVVDMMVVYLREVVFKTVVADSDRAFQRNPDPSVVSQMEVELHALVSEVVDQEARPLFASGGNMSQRDATGVVARAVEQVWHFWESNDQ